jgi:lipid-binding SYLF domain-containing protein
MGAGSATVLASLAAAIGLQPVTAQRQRFAEATAIVQAARPQLPNRYWDEAHCIVVVPSLTKAAAVPGRDAAKGVMSCRAGESWTAPLFVAFATAGSNAPAEPTDLLLLVMNEQGVEKLLRPKTTIGTDLAIAPGSMDRTAAERADAAATGEVLGYARSAGRFSGIALTGGVIGPDDGANVAVYGQAATPRRVMATREISAPPDAAPFLRALGGGRPATAPASTASDSSADSGRQGAAASSAATDDLRARLLDMQQAIDRLLADTMPAPVGTSGSPDEAARAGTVTVERVRLMQLRQQIGAALAALGRR